MGNAEPLTGREMAGVVAFTFDDGPHPDTTPTVLAALKKYDVKATFFVVVRQLNEKTSDHSNWPKASKP